MRRLKGIRKMILIEECWKALTSANMSTYIRYLYKTVRKYFGEAVVVTQEASSPRRSSRSRSSTMPTARSSSTSAST